MIYVICLMLGFFLLHSSMSFDETFQESSAFFFVCFFERFKYHCNKLLLRKWDNFSHHTIINSDVQDFSPLLFLFLFLIFPTNHRPTEDIPGIPVLQSALVSRGNSKYTLEFHPQLL